MYERNAIVIDRYFSEMFGYGENNNLKNNYNNYSDLVLKLKKFQDVSNAEDNIMVEFEKVVNEIKETQKVQESFYRKNLKLQETRKNLFDDLDENTEKLKRKFEKVEEELNNNNDEIKLNIEKFIEEVSEFNNKSVTRTQYGKERRIVENEYQKALELLTDNYNGINLDKVSEAKLFIKKEDINEEKQQIQKQILKNGANEKIKFDENVITNAINVFGNIEQKKLEIFISAYERTGKILTEIKNDAVKIDKHQKFIKDSENKLMFLNTVSEYIVLFLDNERMNVIGGQKEHNRLMNEACQNFEKDVIQIKNMYELLLREISGRYTKKIYNDLYSPEYLKNLLADENNFEKSISKLNVMGAVIYPSYWRVEGMKKIFETFKTIVTEKYGRDLSEYEPYEKTKFIENTEIETNEEIEEDDDDDIIDKLEENSNKDNYENMDEEFEEELDEEDSDDEEFELDDEFWNEEEENDNEYEDDEDNDEDDDDDFEYSEEDENEDKNLEQEDDDEDDDEKAIDEILGFYNDDKKEDVSNDKDDIEIDFNWDEEDNEEDDENSEKNNVEDNKTIEENSKKNTNIEERIKAKLEEKKKEKRGFFNKKKK